METDPSTSLDGSTRRLTNRLRRGLRRMLSHGDSRSGRKRADATRDAVQSAVAEARIPMQNGDWPESIRQWEAILDRYGPTSSWSAHRGIIVAYRELGRLSEAEVAAERAVAVFPDSIELAVARAELPAMAGDWPQTITRGQQLIDRFGTAVPPSGWKWLAIAYDRLGNTDSARRVLQRGRELRPNDPEVAEQTAELSMVHRIWHEAVQGWSAVLQTSSSSVGAPGHKATLPLRGTAWDWYEESWLAIAGSWDAIIAELGFEQEPDLYLAIGDVLQRAQLQEEAIAILGAGVAAHPENALLALEYGIAHLEHYDTVNQHAEVDSLADRLSAHPLVAAACAASQLPTEVGAQESCSADSVGLVSVSNMRAINWAILSAHAPSRGDSAGELGRIFTIRTQRGSSVDLALRAGRYFSQSIIERRVHEVAERDAWPEMTGSRDLTMEQARELAATFGRRFADPPLLPAEDLSDAALFPILHELVVYEPMRRLARDIASRDDGTPVFIESSTDEYRYLDDYPFSNFDVLYLYFELRSLGVNAFLCRHHDGILPQQSTLSFVPGVRALLPRGSVVEREQSSRSAALVPAGIRSVRRVLDSLESPFVLASGSVVQEYAYDRSIRQALPFAAEASVHPPADSLPSYTFDLKPANTLSGVSLVAGTATAADAIVEVSDRIGGNWMMWLDRALHGYLAGISANSSTVIESRGIQEAHICDHLFPDSVLFASAVKKSGGRVVLWPHSANPVHVDERRPGTFDEVHAVTRTGCERWRKRFPEVTVVHSPSAMLDPPRRDSPIDPDAPLSVVVFGGRSIRRYMPLLDRTQLEASYQAFFAGVEDLQKHRPIDLYFKPRGQTGEHEMWLAQSVGATGKWRRVSEHPLRINLPNMLFVSIGMGSSALIEGLNRGIPGLIVRDFPVRDYTTLSDETFPIAATEQALSAVKACTEPSGRQALLEDELHSYMAELDTDAVR